ncbi:MAG TPA: 6-carboxytetrahydropterin synthase [Gemmatimonadales bacterium]|nr:6-carboxytetrahydropterin synthase [Gemmatimonadales bacterium]
MARSLTRVVQFRAEHHYWRPDWSPEENRAAFGAAADAPGHVHEYRCAVTVTGSLSRDTGMIMDLGLLDRILEEEIVRPLDGRHLNRDVAYFSYGGAIPTCEELAGYLYARVAPRLPAGVRLERVRVEEDPTLYAECTGLD